jgi:hypothetical protein
VINLKENQNSLIISIKENSENKIELDVFPKKDLSAHQNLEKENIHFTTINKLNGLLSGYKITGNWTSEKLW